MIISRRYAARSRQIFMIAWVLLAALAPNLTPLNSAKRIAAAPGVAERLAQRAVSALPMAFEPNQGQTTAAVRFISRNANAVLFFADQAVVMAASATTAAASPDRKVTSSTPTTLQTIQLTWDNASPAPLLTANSPLPGKVNYLLGDDPAQWHSNIPTYAGLTYHNLYPGIDLQYNGDQRGLKGTYIVAPGRDPAVIRWRYRGNLTPELDAAGNLRLQQAAANAATLSITEQAPIAWQQLPQGRKAVNAGFSVGADGAISFRLGVYDHSQPLVIDPYLVYSSALTSGQISIGQGLTLDSSGNIILVGSTNQPYFPVVDPFQPILAGSVDGFISKISPSGGTLLYSTFLGGRAGDFANAVAVDASDHIYVTGATESNHFPTLNAYQGAQAGVDDAFLSTFSADGSQLIYSTLLGGEGADYGWGVAVTPEGVATITGEAQFSFPTFNSLFEPQDGGAFIAQFAADGQILFSTMPPGARYGYGVALGPDNAIYVTGETHRDNLPVLHAFQPTPGDVLGFGDGFVLSLTADGRSLRYATYIGGVWTDAGKAIAVDALGQATVVGWSDSPDLLPPVGPLLQQQPYQPDLRGREDVMLIRLNAEGSSLLFGTYLGGSTYDRGLGVAVDSAGASYITGITDSPDYPLLGMARQGEGPIYGPNWDILVTKFDPTGSALEYSTIIGGSYNEDFGNAIALARNGNVVVGGAAGSSNFPLVRSLSPWVYQSAIVLMIGDSCPLSFADVASGDTFYRYVERLACTGVVSGYADGSFRPGNSVTRGQLAKVVALSMAPPADIPADQQTFADVAPASPFWPYVEQLATASVISGYACNQSPAEPCDDARRPYYRPMSGVTRGQTAKIVATSLGWTDTIPANQQSFADVEIGSTFWRVIEQARLHGSISGYNCGAAPAAACDDQSRPFYLPGYAVTRGQMAKIINVSFPAFADNAMR